MHQFRISLHYRNEYGEQCEHTRPLFILADTRKNAARIVSRYIQRAVIAGTITSGEILN